MIQDLLIFNVFKIYKKINSKIYKALNYFFK